MTEGDSTTRWRTVAFGDVVRQVKDRVDPESAGLKRYVAGEHMDTDDLRIRRWGRIGDGYLGPAFHMRFKPGHVLYGSRRTYLRKVAVADFEGVCANTTFVLEPSTAELLPEFLPFVMTTARFHAHSIEQSKGSVNPYINFRDLTWYEFALPPIDVQRQVASTLATFDRYLDCTDRAAIAAEALSDAYIAEAIQSAESSVRLADRVEVLLGRQRHPRYSTGDHMVPYMRAANVKDGHLELSSVLTMNFDLREQELYGLRSGDVLVSEGCGNVEEVGANAVWNAELPGVVCFQKALIRLRAIEGKSDAGFLGHWARHAFRSGVFKSIARGTNIWHISAERTCDLRFPDLPIEQQRLISEMLFEIDRVRREAETTRDAASRVRGEIAEKLLSEVTRVQ